MWLQLSNRIRTRTSTLGTGRKWLACLPLLLTCVACSAQAPRDPVAQLNTRGMMLYENHCQSCHDSIAHVRDNHVAKTIDAVRTQVNRWQTELKLSWNNTDVDDVSEFLNQRYYHY